MKRRPLNSDEVAAALASLPGWAFLDGKIRKEYRFSGFPEAFGFMTRVALLAERLNHHPDWSNTYNRVLIALSTHDAGGVTASDIELAGLIDSVGVA